MWKELACAYACVQTYKNSACGPSSGGAWSDLLNWSINTTLHLRRHSSGGLLVTPGVRVSFRVVLHNSSTTPPKRSGIWLPKRRTLQWWLAHNLTYILAKTTLWTRTQIPTVQFIVGCISLSLSPRMLENPYSLAVPYPLTISTVKESRSHMSMTQLFQPNPDTTNDTQNWRQFPVNTLLSICVSFPVQLASLALKGNRCAVSHSDRSGPKYFGPPSSHPESFLLGAFMRFHQEDIWKVHYRNILADRVWCKY